MNEYTIRDPQTGRTVTVRGDRPPTEQEIEQIFAATTSTPPPVKPIPSHAEPTPDLAQESPAMDASAPWQAYSNVFKGARAGLAQSAYYGGDLIRRLFGMNRIIDQPESQAAMTVPDDATGTGKLGYVAERATEFARPLQAVNAIRAPFLGRVAMNAAAGGGVAALQSQGDPIATISGTLAGGAVLPAASTARAGAGMVRRAAAGAQEGGLGGALAGVVRSVAPEEPRTMLVQALKPRSTLIKFEQSLDRAVPEIKAAEAGLGRPIETIDDLLDATKAAKKDIQRQLGTMRGSLSAMNAQIDGAPIADAIVESIPEKTRLLYPEEYQQLAAKANVYRRPFSVDEVESLLRDTNAELDAFYAQYPGKQQAALTANPGVASLEAQARGLRELRNQLFDRLEAGVGGDAVRELNRRYGALLDVEGEIYRRVNVAKRQQPQSLSEQIGAVRAAGHIARGLYKATRGNVVEGMADIVGGHAGREAARAIKESQTTNALIRRAFAAVSGERTPVRMPVQQQRPIRGLLGPGARPLGPPSGLGPVGEEAPPAGRLFRSPVISHEIDETIPVREGGYRVQFGGDPTAVSEPLMTEGERAMLERMARDLDEFRPERGGLVARPDLNANDPFINRPNMPGGAHYVPNTPGSAVGDDVRVISEQNVSNREIRQAIQDLLDGKPVTNRLHTAALNAARGYLEKRPGYRGPIVPPSAPKSRALPGGPHAPSGGTEDDGFEAFSKAVDDLAGDTDESGFIVPAVAMKLGGGLGGAVVGGAEDKDSRARGAVIGAAIGVLGTAALAKGGPALAEQITKSIKAYHGSPHDFEKFSLSKVGTGEGAAAYGHGLYFAENPKTAAEYRRSLSDFEVHPPGGEPITSTARGRRVSTIEDRALAWVQEAAQRSDVADPFTFAKQSVRRSLAESDEGRDAIIAKIEEWQQSGAQIKPGGKTYEVNINADPEHMLDWDKPINQQSERVQSAVGSTMGDVRPVKLFEDGYYAVSRVGPDGVGRVQWGIHEPTPEKALAAYQRSLQERTGGDAYHELANGLDVTPGNQSEAASKALKDRGVPGIKYLDQGSRATSGGELVDLFKAPEGWRAKVRVRNRAGLGFTTPTDAFTTSQPFSTEEAARRWADERINGGTRNFVIFDDALIEITKKYAALLGIGLPAAKKMLEAEVAKRLQSDAGGAESSGLRGKVVGK